jgi:hypothetical protein
MGMSSADIERVFKTGYADDLFRHLGALEVDSIDAAEYEGATIIHDMNVPIPTDRASRYSLVFDGGTLEHVFNFPVASANVIKLTAIGGHILSVAPANNLCGHGFYQFSPELFFRVFGASNGCEIKSLYMADTAPHRPWQRVTDPQLLRRRVNLHHFYATSMIMLAFKKSDVMQPGFVPQQSDYELSAWKDTVAAPVRGPLSKAKAIARDLLPVAVWSRVMAVRDFLTHTGYRDGYTRTRVEKIGRGEGDT